MAFKTTLTDAYPSAPPFVRDLFLHLKQTLSLTHQCTCLHTNTPTAYATFVTSHTSVISKDTKPTRSHTQFPRMQPKWSCKQALSLTGRKGTGRKIPMLEKEEEKDGGKFRERGERRGGTGGVFRLNTLTFISALQHTYARFWGKVRTLWFVHTQMLHLLTHRKKTQWTFCTFYTRGYTHKKAPQSLSDFRTSWLLAKKCLK